MAVAFKGEKVASKEMRKHLACYPRLRGAARMRIISSCPDGASLSRRWRLSVPSALVKM